MSFWQSSLLSTHNTAAAGAINVLRIITHNIPGSASQDGLQLLTALMTAAANGGIWLVVGTYF